MKEILVKNIRDYLEKNKISPEKFATNAQLSHMTIRRWLKKADSTAISKKYHSNIGPLLDRSNFQTLSLEPLALANLKSLDTEMMMIEIQKSGEGYTDFESLEHDLTKKLNIPRLDKIFPDYCKRLYKMARSPKVPLSGKAVAIGALLYFINPIDLIPDHVPVIGLLDDLVVLSLALNYLSDPILKDREGIPG